MVPTTENKNPETVINASNPVTNPSTTGSSWWGTVVNFFRPKTSPPLTPKPQKGGKPSKNLRKNRTRGGYVIKANSKSQSRRKNSRKKQ